MDTSDGKQIGHATPPRSFHSRSKRETHSSLRRLKARVTFRTGGSSEAVRRSEMHTGVPLLARARVLGDPSRVQTEREGFALVRAHTDSEASELVFRAAFRRVVVTAGRVDEQKRAGAP